ncbi:MAG TPA: UbiX family flavin prenyltransferase [Candidatus Acidoferrales bacterium]|nr:UbiX family flavin prenyltransferase [Candidatus Acidoferrales bacterium]
MQTIVVGITGASGAVYARKVLELLEADARVGRVHLVVSEAGQRLIAMELGIVAADRKQLPQLLAGTAKKIDLLPNKDIGASIASGSYPVDSMAVVPCTTGALASIAAGTSDDLIARAADVCLKEGRRLVLCVRETPLSRIHLENMLRAQAAGAVIMPAAPGFYFAPKTIDDFVTQFACRVLEQLGLPQAAQYRWTGAAKKGDE